MKKLQQISQRLYRMSIMKDIGIIGLLSLVALIGFTVFLWIFITKENVFPPIDKQHEQINALEVKDNTKAFRDFLITIKKDKGVLVLGTSESGNIDGYNYWELLNADPEIDRKFSVFYGAGRFCEKYIPLIQNNPEAWDGIELLIFVNPTYWREGLNSFHEEYQERYLNTTVIREARTNFADKKAFDQLFGGGANTKTAGISDQINQFIDANIHPLYYNNLNTALGNSIVSPYTPFSEVATDIKQLTTPVKLDSIKHLVDSVHNCAPDHLAKNSPAHLVALNKESNYRFTALNQMILLCSKHNIKVHFVLGPYNGVASDSYLQTGTTNDYKRLVKKVAKLLTSSKQPFTDLSTLSHTTFTFRDQQHHSAYGGYLIYQGIKDFYHD